VNCCGSVCACGGTDVEGVLIDSVECRCYVSELCLV